MSYQRKNLDKVVLVLSGCGKDSDDIDIDGDDYSAEDSFLSEYNLFFSDLPGTWKITKFVDNNGKTVDISEVFTISNIDLSKEKFTNLGSEYDKYGILKDIECLTEFFEDKVYFPLYPNASTSFHLQCMKMKSDSFDKSRVSLFGITKTVDDPYVNVVIAFGMPSYKDNKIEATASYGQNSDEIGGYKQVHGTATLERVK